MKVLRLGPERRPVDAVLWAALEFLYDGRRKIWLDIQPVEDERRP